MGQKELIMKEMFAQRLITPAIEKAGLEYQKTSSRESLIYWW